MSHANEEEFLILTEDKHVRILTGNDFRPFTVAENSNQRYAKPRPLGAWQGRKVSFAIGEKEEGNGWHPARSLLTLLPTGLWRLVSKALSLGYWYRTHAFCGVCGQPTRDHALESAMECPSCGHTVWPKVTPAVIVLVTRGSEILLGHNTRMPEGLYSLFAGYVEPGESAEETVCREVLEEAGVEVGTPRFVASQDWPFPDALMLGFRAEWKNGEPRPDGVEISDVGWFSPDNFPALPPRGSMAQILIDGWLEEQGYSTVKS